MIAVPGACPWQEFWATAVITFGIDPASAWSLTPIEFWWLVDAKQATMPKVREQAKPMTAREFKAMEQAYNNGSLRGTHSPDHGADR